MPAGRPTSYTPELAADICLRMSEGESLRKICRDKSMPSMSMVMRWVAAHEEFREQYRSAREDLLEHWAEDILEISDESSRDFVQVAEGETTVERVDHEHIARSKLRVDSRKWLLSKLAAKKYGDRVGLEHSGPNGGPIQVQPVVNITIAPS